MAGRAISEPASALNVIEARECVALGCVPGLRRLHHEDAIGCVQVLGGSAMTFETPLHRQRRDARDERHLIDTSVALDATDTFVDVNAVIEVHEVRQIVYAHPLDRLARSGA